MAEVVVDVLERNVVTVTGPADGLPLVFAHGYGCDQSMWRFITPAFADTCRIVLFDHVGSGASDASAYELDRYASLGGFADDVIQIGRKLDLRGAVLIGHSVSAMIGALAVTAAPDLFDALVMVSPSPRYVDEGDYRGGFSRADIDELLETMDRNYLGWSEQMAPVIIGDPDRPDLSDELTTSFCRLDPRIARHFARTTFLGDNRDDLADVPVPTLVVQVARDAIAPVEVGEYVHARLPDSELVVLDSVGHCPHLSAPTATADAIRDFLDRRVS